MLHHIHGTAYGGIFFPANRCPGAIAHIYDLSRMDDLDPGIVTLVFGQLVFNLGRISNQIELVDLFVIAQRHNGAGNKVRRAKITAHRVEGDLHRCEILRGKMPDCKAKIVAASLRETWLEPTSPTWRPLQLFAFERQHLAAPVVAA